MTGEELEEDQCGETADEATRGRKRRHQKKKEKAKSQPLKFNVIDSRQKAIDNERKWPRASNQSTAHAT